MGMRFLPLWRKALTGLMCAAMLCATARAQQEGASSADEITNDEPTNEKPKPIKVKWGVFGNITTGFTYGAFGKLEEDLKNEKLFNNDEFYLRNLGSYYGGDIWAHLPFNILVGFGGMGTSYNVSVGAEKVEKDRQYPEGELPSDIGDARINATIFMGKIGYCFNFTKYSKVRDPNAEMERQLNEFKARKEYVDYKEGGVPPPKEVQLYRYRYRWMLFPYLGYGGGNSRLRLTNFSLDQLYFGNQQGQMLDRTTEVRFRSSVSIVDLGVGTRFCFNKKGGLMVGAELGGYLNAGGSKWKSVADDKTGVTEKEISEANKSVLQGIYLRVTVGGGFFKISEPENRMVVSDDEDAYIKPAKKDKKAKGEAAAAPSGASGSDDSKPRKEKRTRKVDAGDAD